MKTAVQKRPQPIESSWGEAAMECGWRLSLGLVMGASLLIGWKLGWNVLAEVFAGKKSSGLAFAVADAFVIYGGVRAYRRLFLPRPTINWRRLRFE